jgi:hypothetical protein
METKKLKGGGGIYGPAQIRLTKKSVQVVFDDKKDEDGAVIEEGREFEISRENAPKKIEAGHWSASVSSKGDKLYSVRPLTGTFSAKFLKFAAAQDAKPAPVSEPSSFRDDSGKVVYGEPQLKFTAVIQVEGSYEYPVKLPYRFSENDRGNVEIQYRKLGTQINRLLDFLEYTGVKDMDIPFTDNILPRLEEMIQDQDKTFTVVVKNGWIDSFSPALSTRKKSSKKK